MGFTWHLNGKMLKTMFCHSYKFMIHCVVHALSHRKGAYDETSDYIMNIITCLVLNRPYNVSKVIFEYLVENIRAGSAKYNMYPRFIMMMIDDQFKDIQKDGNDVLSLRNMIPETITRLTKGPEQRVKRMICRINNPAYVAPENDAWRHENSSSDDENEKMNEMVEKRTRWWFVKDGKRKRTPKTSPVVPIPKEPAPKIVVKGPSVEPQQRLVDEPVVNPTELSQEGIDLTKVTFEQFIELSKGSAQKGQSTSVQGESVKDKEPEGVARDDSSEADSESNETETELDLTTLGRGKAQLKKKPTKKKKGSGEEDSSYTPSAKETKKLRAKRKAVQSGVIPRNVRARKGGATLPKDQGGKKKSMLQLQRFMKKKKYKVLKFLKSLKFKVFLRLRFKRKVVMMIMLKSLGLEQLHLLHHLHHKINLFQKGVNLRIQRIKIFLICLEIFLMLLGYTKMILFLMMILMCSIEQAITTR
ncbi:hypothetical protein HanRHA438_Chr03g0103701 [Helianthus annuus]|uniref:Uncharacterized protein n=1 Tax=Helianthus annuus TaxID=4232 RepID=A0A9K3JDA7_HELAN|nr:hypothetical protein HanXRQr2_Chr03g0092521 [Helianthus annuus]KAJ0606747.1 hypothetical protein HanHA89_Chr03g0088641 [Helianthus annuus]KAJ0766806.1 hypothetical protein HanLR1_Chr03g0081811 [Helianthus annuus]KAJ0934110.1 hypothetical protein HanRHA438_Chr03g0103701 [Helianthus annuus]